MYKLMILLAGIVLFPATYLEADTIEVGFGDLIQDAIDDAVDGDCILIEDAIYIENLDFTGIDFSLSLIRVVDPEADPPLTLVGDGVTAAITIMSLSLPCDSFE